MVCIVVPPDAEVRTRWPRAEIAIWSPGPDVLAVSAMSTARPIRTRFRFVGNSITARGLDESLC